MISLQHWLASCAIGVLAVSASQAAAQTAASNPPASPPSSLTTPGASETPDQAQRARATSQNTQAASAATIGEVVVTATAEHRSLQEVPVAASVYTDERRNLVGIEDAADIINFTPSASLNGEFLSIRGVGRYTDEVGTDPGVAVFVDGVYTRSPDYLSQPDFFTDRIEVLRGPQGTLGGQNDIGGSVNVVSKRPTDTFYEEARAGLNNYLYHYFDGAFSGPIGGNVYFRIADVYADQPTGYGSVTNLDNPTHPGSGWNNILDVQLEWKPTSNFDAWVRVQKYDGDFAASYGVNPNQYTPFPQNTPYGVANCPTVNGIPYQCLVPYPQDLQAPTSNPEIKNPNVVDDNVVGYAKTRADYTFTTQLTYRLPGVTAEYIGGYSEYDYEYLSDADGTPSGVQAGLPSGFLSQVNQGYQQEQFWQNEIQLRSDNNSRLQWLAGVFQYYDHFKAPFYYEEPNNPTLSNIPGAPNPNNAYYGQVAELRDTAYAVYGNVDYKLSDTLKITGGLRYNWDSKRGYVTYTELFDTAGIFADPALPASVVDNTTETANVSSSAWTGKVGLEWQPQPATLVYASATKGYKAGGMGLLDVAPVPTVGPETLYDFEGGVKQRFGDKLLIDADVYYYDYNNLQQFLTVQNATTGLDASELVSAQKARTYGFELESTWSPTRDFQLTFNYSYLNARFTEFSLPSGPIVDVSQLAPGCIGTGTAGPAGTPGQCVGVAHNNLNGNTIPQSPENKVTVNPVYTFHTPEGKVTLSATYAFIGAQYYSVFNNPGFLAPSYYDLDLRLLYQPPQGHYTVILFARNVTNQTQIINYSTGSFVYGPANLVKVPADFPSAGQVTYFINPPRTFGIEFQARF